MLHQGHVLVGCGVEYNLGPVLGKHLVQLLFIPNGGNFHLQIQPRAVGDAQLLLNIISVILINVQNNQLFRVHFCDLAAQLAADGAAPSGHQHHLIPEKGNGFFIGEFHGLAE